MAYKNFYNDFNKGICKDVFFLYGVEDYLIRWAVDQIICKYIDQENQSLDVQYIEGNTCSPDDIIGASRAYSMFSERRIIVVSNYLPLYKNNKEIDNSRIIDMCTEKTDASIVIFTLESKYSNDISPFGNKLIKTASSYEFSKLDKAELQSFINKRVRAAGKLLGNKEMNYLIDISGYYYKESDYSLEKLDNDLKKIIDATETDQISIELIDELLIGVEDKYVFNLVDALMLGNKNKAMEIAETVIREEDGAFPVLALLIKQFEIMYDSLELSKEGLSISEMAKKTSVNEFRLKKAYQAARSFNSDTLKKILINSYNIDRDIKIGNIDKDIAFELLIVGV